MKRVVLFLIICYYALHANGQVSTGFSAGPGLSNMSVHLRDLSTFRIKPVIGFNINFIADIRLDSSLSVSTGLSFVQKGFRQTLYYRYAPFTSAEMTTKINYLEIPAYIKIKTNLPGINFFYGIGPYMSIGVKGKVSTLTTDSSYTEEIKWNKSGGAADKNLPETYGYTNLKRFDYGIGSMAGLKYKKIFLMLDFRYSFKNIMWEYFIDEKMSNSVMSLSAGYAF